MCRPTNEKFFRRYRKRAVAQRAADPRPEVPMEDELLVVRVACAAYNLAMDAHDLLRITLALMRDADLPTEEKLAVLEVAATIIRDSSGAEEAMRTFRTLCSQVKRG